MKAITLSRPMAWLVAVGAKTVETRARSTDYRGPLAIHAAAGRAAVTDPYRRQVLADGGLDPDRLPGGVVVALCSLTDCRRITPAECPCYPEYAFGHFVPGWFAWQLTGIRPLVRPVAARGRSGLWEWRNTEKNVEK